MSLVWAPSKDGRVPPGAIAGGREKNNPFTFIGRVELKKGQYIGRIVPSTRSCYAICKAMEHKRSCYEVLVNPSTESFVWRKDYQGQVPDTAVPFYDSGTNNGQVLLFSNDSLPLL